MGVVPVSVDEMKWKYGLGTDV